MAHEGSNGKPDTEGGATSQGGEGAARRVRTRPTVKPDAGDDETSQSDQGAARRVRTRPTVKPDAGDDETSQGDQGAARRVRTRLTVKPDAEGSETSGSHRTSSRPATKKDPSEDSGAAKTKQPKKEDRERGVRRTRNRFEEEE